jgi:hypothetical protein
MTNILEDGMIELDKDLFDGYLSEVDDGVIISHIASKNKCQGNFSKLLTELKKKYKWIKVPTPSKIMMRITLKKGFKIKKEWFPYPFECWGTIMYWKNEN